jgi:hypothetical protein
LIDGEALMVPLVDPVAAPVVEPAGEIADEPGTLKLGTLNGSEAQPGAVAAPPTNVLDIEQGVCVRPVPPGPACVAPPVIEEGTAVLGPELSGGLSWGLTWAWAVSKAASHKIITKMNIRSIARSYIPSVDEVRGDIRAQSVALTHLD